MVYEQQNSQSASNAPPLYRDKYWSDYTLNYNVSIVWSPRGRVGMIVLDTKKKSKAKESAHANVTLNKLPQPNPQLWVKPELGWSVLPTCVNGGFLCRMLKEVKKRRGAEAVIKIKKYYKLQFKIDLKQFPNKKQLHIKFKQPLKLEWKKTTPITCREEKKMD